MSYYQPGILATPVPAQARHLFFALQSVEALPQAIDNLMNLVDGKSAVVGFGESLAKALNVQIDGLRGFPAMSGVGVENPSTQHALWVWLHGVDRGELLNRCNALEAALAPALRLVEMQEAFRHKDGHDLTGYEDGTENPHDEAAIVAALQSAGTDGMVGGSFAAIQQWQHDLKGFHKLSADDKDNIMGRRLSGPDVPRVRLLAGCLRSTTATHERSRRWHHRRSVSHQPADHWRLLLVPAVEGWSPRSARLAHRLKE
jgi:putative iron-dependent peroxidase